MIFYNSIIAKLILFSGYSTITIGPFVFTKLKKDEVGWQLVNHESVHLWQWLEMTALSLTILVVISTKYSVPQYLYYFCFVAYYAWYITEYLIRLFAYRFNKKKAYRNICFEREAYMNQDEYHYIRDRIPFSFIRYIV